MRLGDDVLRMSRIGLQFDTQTAYDTLYFTHVHPEIAHTLSLYRYHLLSAAREKAKGTEH
jgi:trehalose/maltose hydrolase-like predicted phosphorylase